jgi:zinc transporter
VNALLADETRPRISPVGDGVLSILRGVNLTENASPEDMASIRPRIDPHRIIRLRGGN